MILLDTATLLFWTIDLDKLSQPAKQAIQQADKIAISSISIWEIGIKAKNGHLAIPLSLENYVARIKRIGVEVLPVDEHIWLANVNLDWFHRDPADRTIVATAMLNICPVITPDHLIQTFYDKVIW